MPVLVKLSAGLDPWSVTMANLDWLIALIQLEQKMGAPEGGIPVTTISQFMTRKKGRDKPFNPETVRVALRILENIGFVSNVGGNWASTPGGKSAAMIVSQRGSLWTALHRLLLSGKVSKEDVLAAMKAGYKPGSEKEMLDIIDPPKAT